MEELVEAAGAWAAGTEKPGHWAGVAGAQQMQPRAWPGQQVQEEEVLRGEGHWEEDPGADLVLWPGQRAQVAGPQDGCLEWAVELQDEPQGWAWELLDETEEEDETVGAY